jgi:hypothetical protein
VESSCWRRRAATHVLGIARVINDCCEHFPQNPQLTLDVARLDENFVHVIVLLWQPLGDVAHSRALIMAR